jgi:hypothetical protein
MNTEAIETLGNKIGQAALTTLVRLCPEIKTASHAQQDAACAAMRAKAKEVVDEFLDDARAAPWMAEIAFASAVLSLAHEGVRTLRAC